MITVDLLRAAIPGVSAANAERFAAPLEAARGRFVGDNPLRVAMWLAQIAHESGSLRYTAELWGPTDAQLRYEGRRDLGNVVPGDGERFKGRGPIQITGRDNYTRCGAVIGLPLAEQPELLEQPEPGALAAGWFWAVNDCGPACDAPDPVLAVTRIINGGTNGLADRRNRYDAAVKAVMQMQPAGTLAPAGPSPPAEAPAPAAPAPKPYVWTDPDIDRFPGNHGGRSDSPGQPGDAQSPAGESGPPPRIPPPAPPAPPESPAPRPAAMPIPAIVAAAASALLPLVSDLLRSRGSKTSERNAEIVEQIAPTLIAVARELTPGAPNEQAAAERVLADDALRRQFVGAVAQRWADIAPYLEHDAQERDKARSFALEATGSGPLWRQIGAGALLAVLALLVITGGGWMLRDVLMADDTDSQTKGLIIGALITACSSVLAYFFGSTASSRMKDQTISEQAKR